MFRQFRCPQFTFPVSRLLTVGCWAGARLHSLKRKFSGRHWRESQQTPILSISVYVNVVYESWNREFYVFCLTNVAWAVCTHLCLSLVAMLYQCLASPHLPYQLELTCIQLVSGENSQISRTGPIWCCSGDTCRFRNLAVMSCPQHGCWDCSVEDQSIAFSSSPELVGSKGCWGRQCRGEEASRRDCQRGLKLKKTGHAIRGHAMRNSFWCFHSVQHGTWLQRLAELQADSWTIPSLAQRHFAFQGSTTGWIGSHCGNCHCRRGVYPGRCHFDSVSFPPC